MLRFFTACVVPTLLVACATTRSYDPNGKAFRMSHEEAETADQVSRQVGDRGSDTHLRCQIWTEALAHAPADHGGFRAFAKEGIKHECKEAAEAALSHAEEALKRAEAGSNDLALRLAAVRAVTAYLDTQFEGTKNNATATRIEGRARVMTPALLASDLPCEEKLTVPWLAFHAGQRERARELFATSTRSCVGVKELTEAIASTQSEVHDAHGCETVVALAPTVWARAQNKNEQIAVLDVVDRCSDEYSRRNNFSFVPAAVLGDYEALRMQRSQEDARQEVVAQNAEAMDRCNEQCMTMYAQIGGVCSNDCRGETICLRSCNALGEQCRRNCR